ncbi:interleukin 17a/f1 [Clupea harengus]|uniref:Interleukin 17a/f1 n=1 Tax=Clupea harengus TaxID=7950 RepID=A0A6P8GBL8_CLUHA|nr:interleukin 17a/f1 [Clupea harengus]
MHSASKNRVFMLPCLLGVCVLLLMGAQGAPHTKGGGKRAKKDHASVYLLLNTSMADSPPILAVNNSSMSPWEYSFSHDDNRFPPDIAEARCIYTGCLTRSGEEDLDMQSKPIQRQILVLRRVAGEKGDYVFKLDYKTVAVGCTCVRPLVLHQ